jgi:hypothetical protein
MQREAQMSPEWGFISEVAIPFRDDFEFCPDLALIPADEKNRNLTSYAPNGSCRVVETRCRSRQQVSTFIA